MMRAQNPGPTEPIRTGDRGFTLTELMIVLVIFGIVSALALPGFNKFLRSVELGGQVQGVATQLRVLRQRAITENNDYCVQWDTNHVTMSWWDDNNNDGVQDVTERAGSLPTLPTWITVTMSSTNPFSGTTLILFPNGSANMSGSLIYSNAEGYTRSLSVVRPTGMVTVQ